ncbi:MAG: citrate synthase [Calditrichaeota bacterium]|nr:citrate synthase [Calditrichota bacterium]
MPDFAELKYDGKTYKIPVITGTENEHGLDIGNLRAETGLITLDTGYKNTGSTKSKITFLDGEKGILRYRGFPIEQLAEKSNFIEVAYLLMYGELPSKEQYEKFQFNITHHTLIHEDMKKFFDAYPSTAHPMGLLTAMTSSLSSFYPESLDPNRSEAMKELSILRLLAKMPTIISMIYKKKIGQAIVYPNNDLNYTENFINMMFATRSEQYTVDPIITRALDILLILHADHEQNCSTSTVRIVGSSQANVYAAISAGINALWGPLHGGANQAVIEMLENIKNDGGNTKKWLDKAKDKDDPFRLMGFGHRVYKNFDPRAKIIKQACDDVLNKLGINDPVLDIAKGLEEAALSDSYFVERKLYPNVDFYSGIIYRAIGIPTPMFTVMFALGRLPGWIAQWREMTMNHEPIGRPRQIYEGYNERPYVPLNKR